MIDATAAFAPVSLTRIVADDSVRMIQWWADKGCSTPISGDELTQIKNDRYLEWRRTVIEGVAP